jgi:murein L,D-transpeptidase YafK
MSPGRSRRWLLLAALVLLPLALLLRSGSGRPPLAGTADRVVVEKAQRRLTLYRDGSALRSYRVALGFQPVEAKTREGDGRTPEGLYRIDRRKPDSGYHLALHLSYPDAADRARAAAQGVPPGGDIMIHGLRNGLGWIGPLHRLKDWTHGCIALTDAEVDEIAAAVPDGTVVEIRP